MTQVVSSYSWMQGQNLTETFTYDASDQLTAAEETQSQSYQLAVTYGNWGKISGYSLAQTDLQNNTTQSETQAYTYPATNSIGNSQTLFAPEQRTITDANNNVSTETLTFGINGSLRKREVQGVVPHTEHYLFNSQANLIAYSNNLTDFAYYGYNASNTRAYKLGLSGSSQWVNGQQQSLHLGPQQAMFYPNAYINFNQNGEYTKHYYNGAERIASRLGGNQQTIEAEANDRLLSRIAQTDELFKAQIGEMAAYEEPAVNVPARGNGEGTRNLLFPTVGYDPIPAFTDLQPTGNTSDIFYYHTNHLGSTAFVTDQSQTVTQGFLYAPFGEITTEYNATFGNDIIPKYSFNAKELDEETGMYYYEARYYKPPVFTSRDPMFEKYFWMSPYAYCANNPVKYVDPSGEDWFENELTGEVFYNSQMGRDDAGKGNMTGDGWKWMGENNMFGEVNDAFVDDNLDFLYSNGAQLSTYYHLTHNGRIDVYEMKFGGNSEAFMSKMGYKKYPLVQDVQIKETTIILPDAQGPSAFSSTEKNETIEKTYSFTYAPKNSKVSYQASKYRPDKFESHPFTNRRIITSYEHRQYEYSKTSSKNNSAGFLEIIMPILETLSKMLP